MERHLLTRCPTCAGKLASRTGPGRTREYRRGVLLRIPPNEPILTCEKCGERFEDAEATARLDEIQARMFREYAATVCRNNVKSIRERHGVSTAEIEDAIGVTRTYLSQVAHGRREASLPLLHLLRAAAETPGLFKSLQARVGRVLSDPESRIAAVYELRHPPYKTALCVDNGSPSPESQAS